MLDDVKDVVSLSRLKSLTRAELAIRHRDLVIPQVTVIDHPNARLGSWQLGDDICIETRVSWIGDVRLWHRVVEWEQTSETTAVLTLVRTDPVI